MYNGKWANNGTSSTPLPLILKQWYLRLCTAVWVQTFFYRFTSADKIYHVGYTVFQIIIMYGIRSVSRDVCINETIARILFLFFFSKLKTSSWAFPPPYTQSECHLHKYPYSLLHGFFRPAASWAYNNGLCRLTQVYVIKDIDIV